MEEQDNEERCLDLILKLKQENKISDDQYDALKGKLLVL